MVLAQQITKLIVIMLLLSCNTEKYTTKAFNKNRNEILMAHLYFNTIIELDDKIIISAFRENIEIRFRVAPSINKTYSLNRNYENILIHPYEVSIESQKIRIKRLTNLFENSDFKKHLKTLIDLGVKGVKIEKNRFFVTFGQSGVKLKHPDIVNGILISSNPEETELTNCIKEIEPNIYLYDAVL